MTSGCPRAKLHHDEPRADPYDVYARMRAEHGPVVPVELEPGVHGWLVTDYTTLISWSRDTTTFGHDARLWKDFREGRVDAWCRHRRCEIQYVGRMRGRLSVLGPAAHECSKETAAQPNRHANLTTVRLHVGGNRDPRFEHALPETGGDAALYFDPLDVGDIAAWARRQAPNWEKAGLQPLRFYDQFTNPAGVAKFESIFTNASYTKEHLPVQRLAGEVDHRVDPLQVGGGDVADVDGRTASAEHCCQPIGGHIGRIAGNRHG